MLKALTVATLALFCVACATHSTLPGIATPANVTYTPVAFDALPGWPGDALTSSWQAWLASCTRLKAESDWAQACSDAQEVPVADTGAITAYFTSHFTPLRIATDAGTDSGLITGYYEALLTGGKNPKPGRVPIYGVPADLVAVDLAGEYPQLKGMRLRGRLQGNALVPYWSRHDIALGKLPANTPVLAWADDPIDAFFLEVQGSGRVDLDDGQRIRLAYADQNGYPYKSIAKWLVDQGELTLDQASMQAIRAWARSHPERLRDLLDANPSVVFFHQIADDGKGAMGALSVPLTGGSSVAVDPRFVPLGTPVYLSTTLPHSTQPLQRLVHAQDTGGAIRGPIRADFFWGFGAEAAEQAGRMKQRGQVWLLWPKGKPLPASRSLAGGKTTETGS